MDLPFDLAILLLGLYPKNPETPIQELLPFMTAWMELESIMLSEISQVVKDKYHMISPIRGIHFYISRYLVFCSFYSQVLAGSILDE